MLTNEGQLSFHKMGELLFLLMIVHINESSVANLLSFAEVANIAGVHIKMDTSKEKVINVHMQDRSILHFIACTESMLLKNLDDPIMVTNSVYLC